MKKSPGLSKALHDQPERTYSPFCHAHGCPMWGTMAHETKPPYRWWCFLHYRCNPVETPALTERICQNQALVNEFHRVRRAGENETKTREALRAACA